VQDNRVRVQSGVRLKEPPQGEVAPGYGAKPEEGARLIRAFLKIESQPIREAIISFVETLQRTPGAAI
jgi:hypothetical protein